MALEILSRKKTSTLEEIDGKETDETSEKRGKNIQDIFENLARIKNEENSDDLDLSLANSYQPSSIGITFLAEITEDTKLELDFTGGRYFRIPVKN